MRATDSMPWVSVLLAWAALCGATRCVAAPADSYDGRSVVKWQAALADADPHVRRNAAYALGQIGPPAAAAAVPALAKALDDRHLEVAWYAADTLGRFGPLSAAAVPQLVKEMEDPAADETLHQSAAQALGRIGPAAKDAVEPLKKALASKDAALRVAAALALVRIVPTDSDHTAAIQALAKQLQSSDSDGRFAAARAVAELGPAAVSTTPNLINALDDGDDDVRRAAADALGRIGTQAIGPLAEALKDAETGGKSARFRVAACEALGWIADALRRERLSRPDAPDGGTLAGTRLLCGVIAMALLPPLGDSDLAVREAAGRSLSRLGTPGAVALLGPLLGSDGRAAAAAREALVESQRFFAPPGRDSEGDEPFKHDLLPQLVKALSNADLATRVAAFRLFDALQIGPWGQEAAGLLRAGLRDSDPEVRRHAAASLARLQRPL